jgi:tRNA U34 2-thiouridine synthase MnmA/TrmU
MKLELFSYKETAKLWEEKARKSEQLCSTLKHQVDFWNSTSEFWKNTSDYFEERYDFLKEQASNLSKKES